MGQTGPPPSGCQTRKTAFPFKATVGRRPTRPDSTPVQEDLPKLQNAVVRQNWVPDLKCQDSRASRDLGAKEGVFSGGPEVVVWGFEPLLLVEGERVYHPPSSKPPMQTTDKWEDEIYSHARGFP